MSFIEFIGFVLSLLLMTFIVIRNIWQSVQRQRHPQEQAESEVKKQTTLKQFLEALAGDMQEPVEHSRKTDAGRSLNTTPGRDRSIGERGDEPLDKPHRMLKDDFRFQTKMDKFQSKNAIETRTLQNAIEKREASFDFDNVVSEELRIAAVDSAYDIVASKRGARVNTILQRLQSKKDLVVYQEVFGTPKGLKGVWTKDSVH